MPENSTRRLAAIPAYRQAGSSPTSQAALQKLARFKETLEAKTKTRQHNKNLTSFSLREIKMSSSVKCSPFQLKYLIFVSKLPSGLKLY